MRVTELACSEDSLSSFLRNDGVFVGQESTVCKSWFCLGECHDTTGTRIFEFQIMKRAITILCSSNTDVAFLEAIDFDVSFSREGLRRSFVRCLDFDSFKKGRECWS